MKMLLIILAAGLMSGCVKGNGTTEGVLVDVTWEGYVFPTCEMDIQYGEGSSKIASFSSTSQKFCDEAIKLNGKKVKVNYSQTLGVCWSCNDRDLASSIEAK